MTERRLGLGWKSPRRLCWCDDGLISAARARFTRSPSTVEIRMREFVMAERRALRRLEEGGADPLWLLLYWPLCRLHRKEPGWLVGEHIQVLRAGLTAGMLRLGEIGRWENGSVNLTDRAGWAGEKLTRVGEADLARKDWEGVGAKEERAGDVAANAEEPVLPPNRPDGEMDRLNWFVTGRTGPLDLFELALIVYLYYFSLLQFNSTGGNIFLTRDWNANRGKLRGRNFKIRGPWLAILPNRAWVMGKYL